MGLTLESGLSQDFLRSLKGAVGTNQMLLVFRKGVNIYTVGGDAQYLLSMHSEISYS